MIGRVGIGEAEDLHLPFNMPCADLVRTLPAAKAIESRKEDI